MRCPRFVGHGRSSVPTSLERYGIDNQVDDVLSVIRRLEIEEYAVVGYSMGGRIALAYGASQSVLQRPAGAGKHIAGSKR